MTTRLQERIESSRAGQIVLSLFIVVTLVAIGITVMPDSLLRREASKVTDSYLKATGLEQRWRIFAPTQRPFSLRLEAQVRYEDGRTGSISADLKVRDAKTFPPAAAKKAA